MKLVGTHVRGGGRRARRSRVSGPCSGPSSNRARSPGRTVTVHSPDAGQRRLPRAPPKSRSHRRRRAQRPTDRMLDASAAQRCRRCGGPARRRGNGSVLARDDEGDWRHVHTVPQDLHRCQLDGADALKAPLKRIDILYPQGYFRFGLIPARLWDTGEPSFRGALAHVARGHSESKPVS